MKIKVGILFTLMFSFVLAQAQVNNPLFDRRPVHFGFGIYGNYAKLKYTTAPNFLDVDTVQQVNTLSYPGFGVGGIMNVRLAKYFDARIQVNIHFLERHLEYNFSGPDNSYLAKINSTYLDIPLFIKWKAKRHHNTRFYLTAGAAYRHDFASDIDTDRSNTKPIVALQPTTFSYDMGVGVDFYFEYFKFSPEFRLSNGIGNSVVADPYIFASSLSRMSPKMLTFCLLFEG